MKMNRKTWVTLIVWIMLIIWLLYSGIGQAFFNENPENASYGFLFFSLIMTFLSILAIAYYIYQERQKALWKNQQKHQKKKKK